jgi:hypothetical protein
MESNNLFDWSMVLCILNAYDHILELAVLGWRGDDTAARWRQEKPILRPACTATMSLRCNQQSKPGFNNNCRLFISMACRVCPSVLAFGILLLNRHTISRKLTESGEARHKLTLLWKLFGLLKDQACHFQDSISGLACHTCG